MKGNDAVRGGTVGFSPRLVAPVDDLEGDGGVVEGSGGSTSSSGLGGDGGGVDGSDGSTGPFGLGGDGGGIEVSGMSLGLERDKDGGVSFESNLILLWELESVVLVSSFSTICPLKCEWCGTEVLGKFLYRLTVKISWSPALSMS